jgi:hypothetical protein
METTSQSGPRLVSPAVMRVTVSGAVRTIRQKFRVVSLPSQRSFALSGKALEEGSHAMRYERVSLTGLVAC